MYYWSEWAESLTEILLRKSNEFTSSVILWSINYADKSLLSVGSSNISVWNSLLPRSVLVCLCNLGTGWCNISRLKGRSGYLTFLRSLGVHLQLAPRLLSPNSEEKVKWSYTNSFSLTLYFFRSLSICLCKFYYFLSERNVKLVRILSRTSFFLTSSNS